MLEPAQSMSIQKNIAVIMGDGIGPEITSQAIRVLDTIAIKYGHQFNYTYLKIDQHLANEKHAGIENKIIEACNASDAVLHGPCNFHSASGNENWQIQLKKELGLFATIRPVASFASLHHLSALKSSVLADANLVVYREIDGGKIANTNRTNDEKHVSELLEYNSDQIMRIAELAYRHAQKRRKKVTLFHKSNELETSALWVKTIKKISLLYTDIVTTYVNVEQGAFKLIKDPSQFDVILTDNVFGDIISSITTSIAGSRGMLPSASIGDDNALFETVLGAYPDIAGKDIANPICSILSAAMMLRHFGLKEEVEKIIHAVEWTVEHGFVTKDIDPVNFYFTTTIGEMICDHIQNNSLESVHIENIQLRKSTII